MNTKSISNKQNDNNRDKWSHLFKSIAANDLQQFGFNISTKSFIEEAALHPRLLNRAIVECAKSKHHWYDFLEFLMRQLGVNNCFFECSQDVCRTVVKLHVSTKRQITPYTLYFLLRCYDANLVRLAFEHELLDDYCSGQCDNWHLMFVASYQERFTAHCFNSVLESYVTRMILLSQLKCSLNQKRNFLTWFAATLHLHFDEFMKQRKVFRLVMAKLFEMLVWNGLINDQEMLNLIDMLISRGQEVKESSSEATLIDKCESQFDDAFLEKYNSINQNFNAMPSGSELNVNMLQHGAKRAAFLSDVFPLSLKNLCRLNVKRYLNVYTRKSVTELKLPTQLKHFLLFDDECLKAIEFLNAKKKSPIENNSQNDENLLRTNCENYFS